MTIPGVRNTIQGGVPHRRSMVLVLVTVAVNVTVTVTVAVTVIVTATVIVAVFIDPCRYYRYRSRYCHYYR